MLADARPVDTERFAGVYSNGVYCHGCYEGEGWPFGYVTIRGAGPGVIDVGGQRCRAVDSFVFVNERNPTRRLEFTEVGGRVAYLSQIGFGTMRDDRFPDETLGAGWRERPAHPLAARVFSAIEQPDACLRAYVEIAMRRPSDGFAAFYGGRCARGAGRFDGAVRLLTRASDLETNRNLTAYHLGAVHAKAGQADSAFVWLGRAVELKHPRLHLLDTRPDLASIRADPRFAALRAPR
ncbi:MAG TPA: hypothetical protein VM076_20835 [Gemmatimonadaceae bacterium]|nr:hypothetical protein [Gemmatimonadaceae bacterium]